MKNLTQIYLTIFTLIFGVSTLQASQILVTNSLDLGPGTFRSAVANATAGDTITFAITTNLLPITLGSEVSITKPLTILGNGSNMTQISGATQSRILNISNASQVILRDLGFMDGNAVVGGAIYTENSQLSIENCTIMNSVATGDAATEGGGAVANINGTLTIDSSMLSGNSATGLAGSGGGILNLADGVLSITNSMISMNVSNRAGGGIEDNSGAATTVTLNNVNLDNNTTNTSPGNGGGFHITGPGNATITGGTVNNNMAGAEGGGLWNGGGTMLVTGTTIDGNVASGDGSDQGGGGVFNLSGILTIDSCTITKNTADGLAGSGGGILNDTTAMLTINNSIITENTANRAGGGIEDNSGAGTTIVITDVMLMDNETFTSPGNGGGFHITGPGNASITGGIVSGNIAGSEGGGLWNGSGTMTIDSVEVINNTASGAAANNGGGGVFNAGGIVSIQNESKINDNKATGASGSGGGIFNDASGQLTVENSEIKRNTSNRAGGGIEDNAGAMGSVVLTMVNLDENETFTSPGNGGGFHITGPGNATITGGTVNLNNAGAEGGGLWNGSGSMLVDGVFLRDNLAAGDGPDQGGAGIFNLSGVLEVRNSQLIGNEAVGTSGSGGAILNDAGGTLTVFKSYIGINSAMRAGGGIEDNSGSENNSTITDCFFSRNRTGATPGNGGAIHITGSGDMDIINSDFTFNTATSEGGALWNGVGTMTISDCKISHNTASGDGADNGGGGVFNAGGIVVASNGTQIHTNTADGISGSGGGVFNDAGGSLDFTGVYVGKNTSNRAGGGIEDNSGVDGLITLNFCNIVNNTTGSSPGNGGGIHITGPGNLDMFGGFVTSNTASAEGGGLWNGSGTMTVDSVRISNNIAAGNSADQGGGGIFNLSGTVIVKNGTQIHDNQATGTAGSGGGILNDVGGTLDISGTGINQNSAVRAGGGIEDNSGANTTVTLARCYVNDNFAGGAPGNGGGIHITGAGNMDLTQVWVRGNIATREGGGVWNGSGMMTINTCNISQNEAQGNESHDGGGGIFNNGGILSITTSSIAQNTSTGTAGTGGGILNIGTISVLNSTIVANTANGIGGGFNQNETTDNASFVSSIFSQNSSATTGQNVAFAGSLSSLGYNLIGVDDMGTYPTASDDIVGTVNNPIDSRVDPNSYFLGGFVPVNPVYCPSPAINGGDPNDSSDDQRGIAVFGRKDIGSYEVQQACVGGKGIEDNDKSDLFTPSFSTISQPSLYPNPSYGGNINIEIPTTFGENAVISVFNQNGILIETINTQTGTSSIDLTTQSTGVYSLKVASDKESATLKMAIIR